MFRRSMWVADVPADGFGIYALNRVRQICGNNQGDPGNGVEAFMAWPELEANARLISAAPDMLSALQALINADNAPLVMSDSHSITLMDNVRAAIAKATGAA